MIFVALLYPILFSSVHKLTEENHFADFVSLYSTCFALQILEKVKTTYDLPIVTDVHETIQVMFHFIIVYLLADAWFITPLSFWSITYWIPT